MNFLPYVVLALLLAPFAILIIDLARPRKPQRAQSERAPERVVTAPYASGPRIAPRHGIAPRHVTGPINS